MSKSESDRDSRRDINCERKTSDRERMSNAAVKRCLREKMNG